MCLCVVVKSRNSEGSEREQLANVAIFSTHFSAISAFYFSYSLTLVLLIFQFARATNSPEGTCMTEADAV